MDWNEIKTEYITTNTSYRKLAKKHNIPFNTLQCRARKEKWFESQKQYQDNVVTKSVKNAEDNAVDYKSELYELAQTVAAQLHDWVKESGLCALYASGLKPTDITRAIRDIEEALHIKSAIDLKEQNARIKNLQKQAEADDGSKEISITVKGYDEQWQK